ncbi:MAG: DUF11 domain-containing protein [Peptostreptococcaceae bacterium]
MILIKEADKSIVVDLDVITYKITIMNDSPLPIFNVIVQDNIPECTSFILDSIKVNGISVIGGNIEDGVGIDIIPSGGNAIVTFKVQVDVGCNKCSIENVSCVRYILNGTNYSETSNILVIPKECSPVPNGCGSLGNKYIVPGPGTQSATEIVIMSDEEYNGGVMTLPGNTIALSSEAVELLVRAFVDQYPARVSDLNPTNSYDITALLVALNNARIISLLDTPPQEEERVEYSVAVGDVINRPSSTCPCEAILQPIVAQYVGTVICIRIGPWIRIYVYISLTAIPDINCTTTTSSGYEAISTFGPLGHTIYPEPISTSVGSSCGSCGTCGLCSGCALCGPSAILGAASAAALSVISLASLSVLSNTNIPQ